MSKVKTKRTMGKTKYQNDGYLLAFPTTFVLAAFTIYPMTYSFYISFFSASLVTKWESVDFKYYIEALANPSFYKSVLLTFKFIILMVIRHSVLGLILAALLNREFRGRIVLRVILMLPWPFLEAVIALLFTQTMNPMYGVLSDILKSLGTISINISWLDNKELVFPSVVSTCVWKGFPPVMIMILAGLQSISKDLYEAAVIDGVNRWDNFRYTTLSSLKPILATVTILGSVWWFRQCTQIFTMTAGGPGTAANLISLSIYGTAFSDLRFDRGVAWGILVFITYYLINSIYKVVLRDE